MIKRFQPTVLPAEATVKLPGAAVTRPVVVSCLPGERRRLPRDALPLDEGVWRLSMDAASGAPGTMLRFGEAVQTALAKLVQRRLDRLNRSGESAAVRHLARLQELLMAQLDALRYDGWRAERRIAGCWQRVGPELDELVALLNAALLPLIEAQQDVASQGEAIRQLQRSLEQHLAALDLLGERLSDEANALADGRRQALLSSQALCLELTVLTSLDASRLAALIEAIRHGVLVRLPAVLVQLSAGVSSCSETRRYQLRGALNELIEFFAETRS